MTVRSVVSLIPVLDYDLLLIRIGMDIPEVGYGCYVSSTLGTSIDVKKKMFLLADAILLGMDNVTDGLVVYPQRIRSRVQEELPFMITESVSYSIHTSFSFLGSFLLI